MVLVLGRGLAKSRHFTCLCVSRLLQHLITSIYRQDILALTPDSLVIESLFVLCTLGEVNQLAIAVLKGFHFVGGW